MTTRMGALFRLNGAMYRLLAALFVLVLTSTGGVRAQQVSPAGMDSLLDRLVGNWEMSGTVRDHPASYALEASRVLQARFVELHMTDVHDPPQYEARVFIGVDSVALQYIAHWMDTFGAAYSIPPATGSASGDTIHLAFAYPDGPFRDTFVYDRPTESWNFLLESGDSTGAWRRFAEYQVRHH